MQWLANLLRPQFGNAAIFALKQAFGLVLSQKIMLLPEVPAAVTQTPPIAELVARLLAPATPKRRKSPEGRAGEAARVARESAPRLQRPSWCICSWAMWMRSHV